MKNDKLNSSARPLFGEVDFTSLRDLHATPDCGPLVVKAVELGLIVKIREDIAADLFPIEQRS